MSQKKNITIIILQAISLCTLLFSKPWIIGYVGNDGYIHNYKSYSGGDERLLEAIRGYNGTSEYVRGTGFYSEPPSYPSVLMYLLLLLMVAIAVCSVLKLMQKDIKQLNYKTMCILSVLMLIMTTYLLVLPFGHDRNSQAYVLANTYTVAPKLIAHLSVVATTIITVLGEIDSEDLLVGTGAKTIREYFSRTNAAAVANNGVETMTQPLDNEPEVPLTSKLIQYKALLDQGIITQEEFEKKKSELLQ